VVDDRGEYSLWVLPRDVSDHCPLILRSGGWDWGPKHFRFNNYWLRNQNFKEVVEGAWRGNNVDGWMGFVLKEKLKRVKEVIREWNKKEYGEVDNRVLALMGGNRGVRC